MNNKEKSNDNTELLHALFVRKVSPVAITGIFRKNNNDLGRTIEILKGLKNFRKEKLFPDTVSSENTGGLNAGDLEGIMELLKRKDIKFITIGDDTYPHILKQLYTPPPVLFYKGNLDHISNFCIAIVGSRKCTGYGREAARHIAGSLSEMGITVVSGMALGIDSEVHSAALKGRGSTIAVLGCGIDRVYPPENRDLFSEIAGRGLVLSEFFPGTPPLKNNFPLRNRIISGLCRGVVMVEGGERSGAVITCELALQQDREVFAVPGNIFSPYSRGCHNLIKSGARLVEGAGDIMEEFSGIFKKSDLCKTAENYRNDEKSGTSKNSSGLNREVTGDTNPGGIKPEAMKLKLSKLEKTVMDSMGYRPVSLEKLAGTTGLHPVKIIQALSALELRDMVITCGPDSYCRSDRVTGF